MARRAKGEGGLYQNKDKLWVYQYWADGKRHTKRFRRKADANAFMKAVIAANAGDNPAQSVPAEADAPETGNTAAENAAAEKSETTGKRRGRSRKTAQQEPEATPEQEEEAEQEEEPKPRRGQRGRKKKDLLTLGEWLDRWLEVYVRPNLKLSTYDSYEMYVRAHIKPKIGNLYLQTIRVDDLQAFFNDRRVNGNLKGEGGLSPKTLGNMRNMLHAAFKQAVRNRLINDNIVEGVRIPRAEKKEMRVLNRAEQDRLVTAAKLSPELAAFGIVFDLFTGIRLGELCGLRWENVDLEQKKFLVCETRNRLPNHDDSIEASTTVATVPTTKTDNSRRTVYLLGNLAEDLKDYKRIQDSIAEQYPGFNQGGYVFCQPNGNPYEPRGFQDLFKRCAKQAGIEGATVHSMRHTFATRSLEQGMDIVTLSRLLGHATPSITMDKYGHSVDDHKRVSIEKLDDLYDGAAKRRKRASRGQSR